MLYTNGNLKHIGIINNKKYIYDLHPYKQHYYNQVWGSIDFDTEISSLKYVNNVALPFTTCRSCCIADERRVTGHSRETGVSDCYFSTAGTE